MKPEEYLDRLIESREHGLKPPQLTNGEIANSLAAARTLERLNEIDIPPDFASRLELSIRLRARELAHERDSSHADTRPLHLAIPHSPRPRQRNNPGTMHRAWIAALGIAAALMLACVGILTVSAQSLPGDPLYGLKQATEQFRMNFSSSPQDRSNAQIDQLRSTLADLNTVVSNRRSDDAIRVALNAIADDTKSAREAVAVLPAGTDRDMAQQNLQNALNEEDQTLRSLLAQVDWPIKVAFTQQLGVLGDPVPTVTHVTTALQNNGTLLITLTGTNFVPGTRLVTDGRPAGTATTITPEQLTAILGNPAGLFDGDDIGVLNPDGTAAQVTYENVSNDDGSDNNHPRYGTPTPTRGSGGGSGDDSGPGD